MTVSRQDVIYFFFNLDQCASESPDKDTAIQL